MKSVAPGEIATPMTGQDESQAYSEGRPGNPIGRPGHAEGDARGEHEIAESFDQIVERVQHLTGCQRNADTGRLRFGHHGANHPVQDVDLGLVQVTAQNHEVQVVGDSLPARSGFHVSQVNLNDRSVEGLRHADKPIETVQYHPEGAPGPLDALAVFDRFVAAAR